MRLLLFLFLPAVLAMEYPRAPGMYPPEEIGSPSSSGTVPPSPYGGGQHEGPYEFYYEKEPSAPGSNSLSGPRPPGGSERGEADFGRASSISAGSQGRNSGPVPPGGFFSSSSGEQHGSNSVRPGGSSSRHGSTDSNYDFGYEKGPNAGKSGNSYRPSSGLKEQTNGEGLNPIDPYEHGNGRNQPGKEGTNGGSSKGALTDPADGWHTLTHLHIGDPQDLSSFKPSSAPGTSTRTSPPGQLGSEQRHGTKESTHFEEKQTAGTDSSQKHSGASSGKTVELLSSISSHGSLPRPGASSHHGSTDPSSEFEYEKGSGGKTARYRPSSGPNELENGESAVPIDPYEHGKNINQARNSKGQIFPSSTKTTSTGTGHNQSDGGFDYEDTGTHDSSSLTDTGTHDPSSLTDTGTHGQSSSPNGDLSSESVSVNDPHENSDPQGSLEKQSREELTGGKGYRADKDSDFGVEKNFKGEEAPSLRSSSEDFGKALPNDLTEVSSEIDKLERLAVTESDQEESFKSTTGKTPDTFKPCCACCKGEVRTRQPVLGGGYIESTSSQIAHVPGGLSGVAGQGYPTGPANPAGAGLSNGGSSPVYAQTPNFVPTQYGGSYGGGGGGCGCAPQICCQIAQPCCMPSLPCCPPPPPIPCCPQISICCQPIVPCCISLPQICLPTIPLCFRSCPACPCRRRRSVEDPRHHSRTKRQSCMRRVKRQSNCRQCNGLNGLSQPSGGCGTCNGSHRRVKRLGCLPCGRKKREALAEEEHIRQKRSCLPCLGGRKKRQVPNGGSCQKCSLLQTFITRQKRSLNCGPCGGRRKKRAPSSSSCSCASSTPHNSVLRMKRAIVSNYDELDTCDRNCCDYSKCWELRAKKLDLKNFTS